MANTFSQSLTGTAANYRYNQPKESTCGDTDIAGNVVATGGTNSFYAAQQGAMARNAYILTKGPDGLLTYHVIDAERSSPGNIVLRKV